MSTHAEDFAAELDRELEGQVDQLYARVHGKTRAEAKAEESGVGNERYDATYFDSDDEEEAPKKLTNEELLYDPQVDDDNERWIDEQRNKNLPPDMRARLSADPTPTAAAKARNRTSGLQPLPTSDAILNCPSCMTTLCLDCQRHERHLNQFRAMFVMNMHVNRDEVFEFKEPAKKQPRGKQPKRAKADANGDAQAADGAGEGGGAVPGPASEATRPEDQFNPAYCAECSTLVAMYDIDEVYHFFNVIDSEG